MTIAVDISRARLQKPTATAAATTPLVARSGLRIAVEQDLSALEDPWCKFQETAHCTVFQTYQWVSAWQSNIGSRNHVTPAIVVGTEAVNKPIFLLPLAIRATAFGRELTWLASQLCDYNAPLLAAGFYDERYGKDFVHTWADIQKILQASAATQFDYIRLKKMIGVVGSHPNPMLKLGVYLHPSQGHATTLIGAWEEYYTAKRSSSMRRRDRTKLKRLSSFGDVSFHTARNTQEALGFFATLVEQKTSWFGHSGMPNMFACPGYLEFYHQFLNCGASQNLFHVSKLQVGTKAAAVNLGLVFQGRYHRFARQLC